MKRFVEGMDRGQSTLFPECLEDWICEDNPVRVIDVFVGGLDLAELRFCGALAAKTAHLKEKLAKLATEMQRLKAIEKEMLASPDQQISLTDPDSRSMATSGRGSGVVGYNVQVAVDTEHHLIVTHEVTNTGSDRSQLAKIASQAKDILGADHLDAVADRGYFNSPEILACEQADITGTLPKPMTSGAKSDGRFGKQDFVYLPTEDVYRCPAGEKLAYRYTNEEDGKTLRRYWTTACSRCPLKSRCFFSEDSGIPRTIKQCAKLANNIGFHRLSDGRGGHNVTRTILGEVGESATPASMAAVASVIRNRLAAGGYGKTPTDIVRAPNQFEPWNAGSGNDPSSLLKNSGFG